MFLGTEASIKKSGLAGRFFIVNFTSSEEIIALPLAVEVRITSKWWSDSWNFEKAKAKPPYFSASSSGFLRLRGHQSKVRPVTVIAWDPLDLKASMADSATSPAPITRSREFETLPKILRANSQSTLPKFTCPLDIPVLVLAQLAAWKPFWKRRLSILPETFLSQASS